MSCHWEESDVAVQEMFSNVRGSPTIYGSGLGKADEVGLDHPRLRGFCGSGRLVVTLSNRYTPHGPATSVIYAPSLSPTSIFPFAAESYTLGSYNKPWMYEE